MGKAHQFSSLTKLTRQIDLLPVASFSSPSSFLPYAACLCCGAESLDVLRHRVPMHVCQGLDRKDPRYLQKSPAEGAA